MQGERFELSNPLRERALNPSHLARLCYPCINVYSNSRLKDMRAVVDTNTFFIFL